MGAVKVLGGVGTVLGWGGVVFWWLRRGWGEVTVWWGGSVLGWRGEGLVGL
ncbi:uncharacterized protein G2W53_039792 [Senna tora]|uniref:Uncharacterized protein n=1 Tax=Senna tora TaxID=362788 RepID=A0A834SQ69_9FABA|nr:uncharacterized protein G2W53_039792 [Senna tora]